MREIARATRGESSLEDVEQSVWLLAHELGARRGYASNLLDPTDQDFLVGCLYNRLVKYTEKLVRHAVRVDEDPDDDGAGAGAAIARLLVAPSESDPAVTLLREEAADAIESVIHRSYSQAAAYLLLLRRFRWSMPALAEALRVVAGTLRQRIDRAVEIVKVQPSLFDGIAAIDPELRVVPAGRAPGRAHAWVEPPQALDF